MANVDNYPPRYYQYLATQRRVSDWVQNTHPESRQSISKRSLPPVNDDSSDAPLPPRSRYPRHNSQRSTTRRKATTRSASESRLIYRRPGSAEKTPVPPAVALLSSSLFICALLPSILTISAFVVLLTLSTLDSNSEKEFSVGEHKPRKFREGPVEVEFSS